MRRQFRLLISILFVLPLLVGLGSTQTRAADPFPALIELPNGWLPEGVVTGHGPVIYSGSRGTGAVYAADLRTGEGEILVPPQSGRAAIGLSFDERSGYLFVAGGGTGQAFVYDAASGESLAAFVLTSDPQTFVNDVIVTRSAAYFTDSFRPVIYRLPLGPGGRLPGPDAIETISLSGDYQHVGGFNLNGIEATPDGSRLIVVHSTLGVLYLVNPLTGAASAVDLGGASLGNGDGILLQGRTLYVVRNFLNQIAVVELAPDYRSGVVSDVLTDANFDVPTTVAAFGAALYAVNARFTTPPTPDTEYHIVRVMP